MFVARKKKTSHGNYSVYSQSEVYGREVAVEVAVNLQRAIILYLNTRGHCGAVWRSRGDPRGQQGGCLAGSVVSSQVRRLQGRHGRQDAGGGGGGGGGGGECGTLWVRLRVSVLPQ